MTSVRFCALVIAAALCGCSQVTTDRNASSVTVAGVPVGPAAQRVRPRLRRASQSPIQHVVIIVQENRSVDNLFQFLKGANTQSYGFDSHGNRISLRARDLAAPFDPAHAHVNWLTEYANGAMNGFDKEVCKGICPRDPAYSYVPRKEVAAYYTMARTYTFGDEMFEPDQGPSFVSHQYLVSGTSTVSDGSQNKASNNPFTPTGGLTGGCDSPPGSLVTVINPAGGEPPSLRTYPCFKRQSLMDELDAAGVSWKYYQAAPGPGIWNAPDAIYSIWSNPGEMAANVISPPSQVLTDIAGGQLANVVWVTPTGAASDHPKVTDGSGPSWVASIVNAVGNSSYWNNTAILIVWDDWGGFYDHVSPTIYNSFELGFRVPLVVVSPYAKTAYMSHVPYEFGSILKFVEETFGLPSLGTTDQRANDLSDCFVFTQKPRPFETIPAKYPPSYFFRQTAGAPGE